MSCIQTIRSMSMNEKISFGVIATIGAGCLISGVALVAIQGAGFLPTALLVSGSSAIALDTICLCLCKCKKNSSGSVTATATSPSLPRKKANLNDVCFTANQLTNFREAIHNKKLEEIKKSIALMQNHLLDLKYTLQGQSSKVNSLTQSQFFEIFFSLDKTLFDSFISFTKSCSLTAEKNNVKDWLLGSNVAIDSNQFFPISQIEAFFSDLNSQLNH